MSERTRRDEPPELGVRICRYCRRRYSYPKGARNAGCPHCAPTLFEPTRPIQK